MLYSASLNVRLMNFNERIAYAIAASGKKYKTIAAECGVSPSAVTQWTTGDTKNVKPENLYLLAKQTGFRLDWLASGEGPERSDGNVQDAPGPARSFYYPEISEVAAGNAIEAIDLLQPGEGERHQSDAWAGPHGFWLRVRGDSMTRSSGISFPEGMIVLVLPGAEPEPGQFIIAKNSANEVTFKQFIIDAGVRYMKPLNSAYQQQQMGDQWHVIGTVVDAKWPRSAF